MSDFNLEQEFKNNFDCYSEFDAPDMTSFDNMEMAMTKAKFVEVVSKLLQANEANKQPDTKALALNSVSGCTLKDKEHYDALLECCTKILDTVDAGKVPQREIMGLRILLNR